MFNLIFKIPWVNLLTIIEVNLRIRLGGHLHSLPLEVLLDYSKFAADVLGCLNITSPLIVTQQIIPIKLSYKMYLNLLGYLIIYGSYGSGVHNPCLWYGTGILTAFLKLISLIYTKFCRAATSKVWEAWADNGPSADLGPRSKWPSTPEVPLEGKEPKEGVGWEEGSLRAPGQSRGGVAAPLCTAAVGRRVLHLCARPAELAGGTWSCCELRGPL